MHDEIWNARRKKLEDELKAAVVKLSAHTKADGFRLALDDGRVILCGIPMKKEDSPK